jgi:hypothetical protein
LILVVHLDEPHFKSKRKKLNMDPESSLGMIDDEELEHLQSDAEEEEEEEEAGKEGSITSDVDDEDNRVQNIAAEPLYVLPLYAVLSSEKQARVCLDFYLFSGDKPLDLGLR